MAVCKSCGVEQARIMSDLCGNCAEAPPKPIASDALQVVAARAEITLSEGDYVSMIGNALIWLSIAAAVICSLAFGRVEIGSGYDAEKVWNSSLITTCIAAGLNGVFFGFLLSKVGSVLKHLEKPRGGN